MCLGVPMQVCELKDGTAVVELGGVRREVSTVLVEECEIGDYVLVHAGFAISKLDGADAEETIAYLHEKYSDSRSGPN